MILIMYIENNFLRVKQASGGPPAAKNDVVISEFLFFIKCSKSRFDSLNRELARFGADSAKNYGKRFYERRVMSKTLRT